MITDIRSILRVPSLYELSQNLLGGNFREVFVNTYVKAREGDKILDIGCGPGGILPHLPKVDYLGFDMDPNYIDAAVKMYGDHGTFVCKKVSRDAVDDREDFDIVMAIGILHHLTDPEAADLFQLAHSVLKPGGRLVTIDCCYAKGQNPLARWMISRDRGRYPRTPDGYQKIAEGSFKDVAVTVRHDLLRIPWSSTILVCTK